ncbi:hydroxymethylglutaryl-CoA synthase family protein [Salinispira pacifica]
MPEHSVGLGDIAAYIPRPSIDMETLLAHRVSVMPELSRKLRRAVASTGQRAFRFPEPWQDSATLAAGALRELVVGLKGDMQGFRHLAVGTETTVDLSKPVASYVLGMASLAGISLPGSMSTFQAQHACAGGTIALLSIAAQLAAGGRPGERGVVICTDIARYRTFSTAEITQGAGAVSLLVEQDPALLELDIGSVGYASSDVDDFFRPIGSVEARVKGGYSVQCYNESLDVAFRDHCARRGVTGRQLLEETDILVFHVPFYQMAVMAARRLLATHLGLTGEDADRYLALRGFPHGIEPLTSIGNIYTGSLYLALAHQLAERYRSLGSGIVGRRVLLASYGSGNTMMVVSGQVAKRAVDVIGSWNLERISAQARPATVDEYEAWIAADCPTGDCARHGNGDGSGDRPAGGGEFYLAGIREDGYREYGYAE